MKKIFYIFAASLLVACSGSNEGPVIPDAYTEPFTLSVDTDEVEADGVSVVTFSFKDSYGREMLDDRMVRANITIASTDGILVDSFNSHSITSCSGRKFVHLYAYYYTISYSAFAIL